jgi:putative membrane protein insertion efficiency factor
VAAVWLLLLGVRFYQAVLSPLMFSICKFYPSCSHYAAEALEKHGARRGLRLAAGRLWRCRPFTQGGYDPVPDELDFDSEEASIHEERA